MLVDMGRWDSACIRGSSLSKVVAFLQLRALRGVSFAMPKAEVLSHKRAVAIGKIASVDLLRSILAAKGQYPC